MHLRPGTPLNSFAAEPVLEDSPGDPVLEGIAEAVAKSDARFYDPYTGKPMAWDATARQLSFKPTEGLINRKPFNLDKGRLVLRL